MWNPGKVLVLALAVTAGAANAAEYKAGEVIVKYKSGVVRTRSTMNMLYNAAGVKAVKHFTGIMKGYEQIILDENVKVQDAIAAFERDASVDYAQPNYIIRISPQEMRPSGSGIPCIPGFEIPGCDPADGGGGDGGGDGDGEIPCIFPGIPFPPGCKDDGGGGIPGIPGGGGGGERPALNDAPAEVIPPVADPDLAKAWSMEKISAPAAWETHRGGKKMIVAVIDTGIDYNHKDLSFNVWRNPNPTKNDIAGFDFIHNDGLPFDDQGHGTHCAGSIGAVGGNGVGISGVNQNVSIMGVKFLSAEGSGTTADAIKGIDYAVTNGAKVLSNSWGGPGDEGNKALYDAIEQAKAKDVLFIAAAGNGGPDQVGDDNDNPKSDSYPAMFDNENLIAVAATDKSDKLGFFSNYGKKSVHVAAPGVDVYSLAPNDSYQSMSGTSMACPHVAGAAALLWSKNPSWDYKKVKEVLMSTVDKIPGLANKTVSGGRINVQKALLAN